jgi:putative transposase
VTPTARRTAVGYGQSAYAFSQRRACRVVGAHRRTIRYQRHVREDEESLRTRLRSLAGLRSRWGYRRLHVLLPWERTDKTDALRAAIRGSRSQVDASAG